MMKTLALATAAALFAAGSATAFAKPVQTKTVTVDVEGIDLNTEQGQKTLKARVDRVARKVCGFDDHDVGSRIRSREAERCYKQARKQTERQVAALIEEKRLGG